MTNLQVVVGDPDGVPMIWTSKGNLPEASLTYKHEWIDNDNETILAEEHYLDGELVKRAVHVKLKQAGVVATAIAADLT
jgi:hypothetical protein